MEHRLVTLLISQPRRTLKGLDDGFG